MFRKFRAGGRQPGLRAGLESIGMPCRLHRLPMGIHEIWTSKLLFGHMLKWADVCWKEHLRKTAAYIWWEKPWCSWTVFSKSNMKEKRHHSGNCLCSQVSKHKARIPELLLGTGVVDEHYNGERFLPMGIYLKTKESGWPWGSIVFFKERDETLQIALQIPMLYIGLCTWWQWTQGKKKIWAFSSSLTPSKTYAPKTESAQSMSMVVLPVFFSPCRCRFCDVHLLVTLTSHHRQALKLLVGSSIDGISLIKSSSTAVGSWMARSPKPMTNELQHLSTASL